MRDRPQNDAGPLPSILKELPRMRKHMIYLVSLVASLISIGALAAPPVASANSPWWQIVTGTRPTNMWEPTDNEQEIATQNGSLGSAFIVAVQGETIGCLGSGLAGSFLCPSGFSPIETAAQLEEILESAFGATEVNVTGGPLGGEPFRVVTADRAVPAITVSPAFPELPPEIRGTASTKILSAGGSGRLVLTITNLGDARVDATTTPVKIVDELPEDVVGTGFEAFAGTPLAPIPVECVLEGQATLTCSFEGELPPYEAIEVEVFGTLKGTPPAAGAAGKVSVSGGNALPASAAQPIKVSPAKTPFGFEVFSSVSEEEGGGPVTRAGAHPFQQTTTIQFNAGQVSPGATRNQTTVEQPALPRNVRVALPAGLIGNIAQLPACEIADFFNGKTTNMCGPRTAIGAASVTIVEPNAIGLRRFAVPVFNLRPAVGEPARFGFLVAGVPIVIDTAIDPNNDYRIVASVRNASQLATVLSTSLVIWGVPGDPRHDSSRGWNCAYNFEHLGQCERPVELGEEVFLREPVTCSTERVFSADLEPWNSPPGSLIERATSVSPRLAGCNQIPFEPAIAASPTTRAINSASGLSFQLNMPNSGLLDGSATAEGQAKKVEVTLPEGVTVNPSQAEGLGTCGPAEYAHEKFDSAPGEGCPNSSKIGTVDIGTPLLEEEAHGAVYVAKPHDNPFNSLLALYLVAKIPDRGVLVKQAGEVKLDPDTGQIVTTFDDLPQIPFESFKLHFFEDDRAPLTMPSTCGSYDIVAKFMPWSDADPSNPLPSEIVTKTSSFELDRGPDGTPCPSGTLPFKPGFSAGTENNAAGSYSPFVARLTRNDGEQEFSRFSLKLPKGVTGNLSGIPFCSEAVIAQARSRTGVNGGQEELESPSCPAASQIGRTLVGAGVGPSLTYVPGKLYLAGPYQGAKLSAVAITPAKVGPFDLGNVVIRQALKVDPVTAEVSTDGSNSDPIPHILQGIVVHARDIRVIVDRKDFVLNPTSCERMTASASVSGLSAVDVSSPFQAADCASLGFKPKLALSLKGGTKRTGHPRLKAVLTARKGDANIREAVVALPHSEFLEQSHIRTICTRVQFNAGGGNGEQCPKGSIYGRVKAVTPLLDEPLSGPVYLRSSNHPLPDLVAALHSGKVDIDLAGRIDSVNGGIRNSFEAVPDAPVTKFTLEMQGGKKGLLVNSTDICRGKHRASATFTGQNGKRLESHPLLKAKCGGKAKGRHNH